MILSIYGSGKNKLEDIDAITGAAKMYEVPEHLEMLTKKKLDNRLSVGEPKRVN